MKLDILALGVHPDDIELSCGGTLLSQIDRGKKVGILDLTKGELGTRGTAETRLQEAEKAADMMGVLIRKNIGLPDCFFENNKSSILKIIKVIRCHRPEIILANALSDRHPDHGRAAKLTHDACFYAGLRKIETFLDGELQSAWRPKAIYHYIQDEYVKPDIVVDISSFIDRKFEIIKAYKSQFYDPDSTEPITPISGPNFLEVLRGKNAAFARPAGFDYAEAFSVNRTIGVKNIFDLS